MPDLTATVLDDARYSLMDTFFADRQTSPLRLNPPLTLKALAENQKVNFAVLPDGQTFEQGSINGKTCQGRRVEFLTSEDTTLPTIDATPQALDCTISATNGVESKFELYAANLFATRKFIVNSKDCNQPEKAIDRINYNMLEAHAAIGTALNRNIIGTLQSSAQAITAGNQESGTINGTTLEYSSSRFDIDQSKNMSLFSELETVAAREAMGMDFLILDSGNFNTAITQSAIQPAKRQ